MIKIFTFHFNNPDFLEKQYHSFKKHLKEPHELICINNASGYGDFHNISDKCSRLGVECHVPQNINHDQAGWSHQTALNWAFHTLIAKHDDTIIIVDHDIFPIKEFKLFKEYDVAVVMQGRGEHIKYFHPGIIIIHPSFKDREQIDFTGEEIDGYRCDTGGNIHHYLQSHPELKIKEMSMVDVPSEEFKEKELQMCHDFIIHFRGGSNWHNMNKESFRKKVNELDKILGL